MLCKGVAYCNNKNDLRWCKNATIWDEPSPEDWKPISGYSMCSLTPTDGFIPSGQQIRLETRDNGLFNCFNRADESPFLKARKNHTKKDWLQVVNTPCSDNEYDFQKRRCLGRNPNQCVYLSSKFKTFFITKYLSTMYIYLSIHHDI